MSKVEEKKEEISRKKYHRNIRWMLVLYDLVVYAAAAAILLIFYCRSGMIVDILYYCAEHGWEVVKGVRVSGNQVAAYFHSVSAGTPVSLIYKLAAANGGNDNNGNTTTGTSKGNGTAVSPKTGQNSMIPVAGMAVVLLGIGAFAVVRSRKEI